MSEQQFHLVLIEDNPADVYLVQEALRTCCIDCRWTVLNTYEAAMDALSGSALSGSDVMLIDLNLKTGSGLEILTAVRQSEQLKSTRVAIVTSSDSPRDKEAALALGADVYVRKPAGLDEFFETISSAVLSLLGRRSSVAAQDN